MDSQSADELVAQLDKVLEEYEVKNGIPTKNKNTEKIEEILNFDTDLIRKFTAEVCGEYAVTLGQYAYHIQRCYNSELSRFNWAESILKRTIAKDINNYKAYSFEERRMLATRENEHAKKLESIKIKSQARLDRIGYLSGRLEFLAKTFMELQQSKRRNHA